MFGYNTNAYMPVWHFQLRTEEGRIHPFSELVRAYRLRNRDRTSLQNPLRISASRHVVLFFL